MKRFLVVGKTFAGLERYILQQGHEYVVLRDSANTSYTKQQGDDSIFVDFSNRAHVVKACDQLVQPIHGVLVTYENYVLPAAWIAHHFHLPGMPIEAAKASSDKLRMRELFAQSTETISPDFHIVESKDDMLAFAQTHQYPLMLKPANLVKSLLITKNHNEQELLQNYEKMQRQIPRVYQTYAAHLKPKILIEEFMEGSIHSVDAFVDKNGTPHVLDAVVDYQTGYDIGFDDNFHYSRRLPSSLSATQIEAIRHTALLGCQALGMKSSPAHVEIIVTPAGPRIVEIGARNGGYRERMHRLSNGLDILGAALHTALGEPVSIKPIKNEPCAVLELFPKQPGIFMGIANEKELRQLPSLAYLSIKAKPEIFVGSSSDGYKMCAVIILHHADNKQFEKDLSFVNQSVYVLTKPDSTQ